MVLEAYDKYTYIYRYTMGGAKAHELTEGVQKIAKIQNTVQVSPFYIKTWEYKKL
jgi:hypothetical protein